MWPRRTHRFRSPGSPTDASLPGWQPVPSALGWPSAMYATAVCHHSRILLKNVNYDVKSHPLDYLTGGNYKNVYFLS